MTAPLSPETARKAVIEALTNAYFNDPKCAVEIVTGVPEYDSSWTSSQLEALSGRADELANDLWDLIVDGTATPKQNTEHDRLCAARDALGMLADDAEQEERFAAWRLEDRPYHKMPRYA